ncbi:hypothetical protein [Anaeromyxobacter oryzisoli]|uniref:hypothetical protein n=1 Tax=Anaeromyxobacter oryzisoli TaxID=2925408 RepID=UPI001F565D50|nr:hypothetical protein [Anaeromyxobacter sp. SG63]
MGTIVRFALQGAGTQRYRAAFAVLAQLGLTALEVPLDVPMDGPCAGRVFPASAIAAPTDRIDELARAAFVALRDASLRPMAVSACRLDPAAWA